MMKKEYYWFTVIALLIFGYVLDRISGTINLGIRNPYLFLKSSTLSTYPLTAVSVIAKAAALAAMVILALSYLVKSAYGKASILFLLGALAQLYAIQQLATHGQVTPVEWTLGIAYAGAILLPFIALYILQGLLQTAQRAIVKEIQPVRHDLKARPQNQEPLNSL